MQREAFEPEPPPSRRSTGSRSGALAGLALLAATVLGKGKVLLGLVKVLPFGKILLTSGSVVLSVAAYAAGRGLAFAVGFVLLILVHELGHGAAMKAHGIRSGWPVFIPFFGAMIAMKDRPEHPRIEADIAYAGPLAGTAASLVCAAIGLLFHSPFFIALAYAGFFLNLFNLVPFGFLDGGRIARVISKKAWLIGAVLLVVLFLKSPSPQLLIIGGFGAMHAFRRQDDPDLQLVTAEDRRQWSFRYFGLCAFLAVGATLSHSLLEGRLG
jgi:Zn-dependent protease